MNVLSVPSKATLPLWVLGPRSPKAKILIIKGEIFFAKMRNNRICPFLNAELLERREHKWEINKSQKRQSPVILGPLNISLCCSLLAPQGWLPARGHMSPAHLQQELHSSHCSLLASL